MTETQYGRIKAEERPKLPDVDLVLVPHGSEDLLVARFGPKTYTGNRTDMARKYWNSQQRPDISFRPATTAESVSASAYDFTNIAKPEIFDPRWLQAGYVVRTSEGVFANPPLDGQGKPIMDEKELKKLLNRAEPIKLNGDHSLYIIDNSKTLRDFGFAEYDTFQRDVQDANTFVNGGLARLLEHTQEPAKVLAGISDKKNYPKGVNVWEFGPVESPVLRVAELLSHWCSDGDLLYVYGSSWDDGNDGCAFGVLK